jgi:hypothetical protein
VQRVWGIAALAAGLLSLALAGPATAAVEVGNNCVATGSQDGYTAIQLSRASSRPEPLAVPADGVLTKWRVNATIPLPGEFPLALRVFRPLEGNRFAIVAGSGTETAGAGINLFDARIPVRAGDRFGTAGKVLYCDSAESGDLIGRVGSILAPGGDSEFDNQEEQRLVAVTGIVEPDADGDGFGDETQDLCTISAARQDPCPPVIHQATAIIKRKAVLVLVTASGHASVSVGGTVKLPKGGTARIAPVTREVAPPKVGHFLLKLPKRVVAARASLAKGKSLQLIAKATVTDDVGRVDSANGKFKLK